MKNRMQNRHPVMKIVPSRVSSEGTLSELRQRVIETDRELLRIVSRRLDLCEQIGRMKRQLALPVRDVAIESSVIVNARASAAKHQMDPNLAEYLIRQLIECSVRAQELIRDSE